MVFLGLNGLAPQSSGLSANLLPEAAGLAHRPNANSVASRYT